MILALTFTKYSLFGILDASSSVTNAMNMWKQLYLKELLCLALADILHTKVSNAVEFGED